MEPRLVRRQGDRLGVSRVRFGIALEGDESAGQQDPAFDMTGLLLQPRLELFGCGGEFGPVVRRGGYGGASGSLDRRRRADRRIDDERRRRQQGGYTDGGADAPRGLGRAQAGRPRVLGFLVGRREHAPSDFGAHCRGLVRGEPPLRNLAIDVPELPAK